MFSFQKAKRAGLNLLACPVCGLAGYYREDLRLMMYFLVALNGIVFIARSWETRRQANG